MYDRNKIAVDGSYCILPVTADSLTGINVMKQQSVVLTALCLSLQTLLRA